MPALGRAQTGEASTPRPFDDGARLDGGNDPFGKRFGRRMARLEQQLWRLRPLVGLRHAGEILDLTGERPFVEALGVARNAVLERRIDENFDELPLRDEFAHSLRYGKNCLILNA